MPGIARKTLVAAAAAAIVIAVIIPGSCSLAHSESSLGGDASVPAAPVIPAPTAAARTERGVATAVDASSFWLLAGIDERQALDALLARMGPAERLGQLFMLSYAGGDWAASRYSAGTPPTRTGSPRR